MTDRYLRGGLLLALTITATTARAQASYQPGYVVTLAGDTVRGQVQEVSARRNSLLCRFRATATGPVTDYAPAGLRAYGIWQGAAYRARAVPPADSAAVASGPQQVFLEVLVQGAAQLYSSREQPSRTRYFVAVGGPAARLRELAEYRVQGFANGVKVYETRSLYRDTLAAALRGCLAVQVQLPRLPFLPAALTRVVSQYNSCMGGPVAKAVVPATRRRGVVLSALAGYQAGSLRLSGNGFFSAAPPLRQAGPVAGLALNVVLPHTRRTVNLRLEALYAHEVFNGEYTDAVSTAATPTFNKYRFDLQYLHLPVLLRYTLLRSPRLHPFLEAGMLYSRLLSSQSALSLQRGNSQPFNLPFFGENTMVNNQFGLQAGAGLSLPVMGERRLALLARAATSTGPSDYVTIAAPITYYSVLLGLDISKP